MMENKNMEQVVDKIKEIISRVSRVKLPIENINDATDLIEDLGLDSVAIVQTIVVIEKEFNIQFLNEELTVELLAKFGGLKEKVFEKLANKE